MPRGRRNQGYCRPIWALLGIVVLAYFISFETEFQANTSSPGITTWTFHTRRLSWDTLIIECVLLDLSWPTGQPWPHLNKVFRFSIITIRGPQVCYFYISFCL